MNKFFNKIQLNHINLALPVLLSIVYFFAIEGVVNSAIYSVIAILVALFYFPISCFYPKSGQQQKWYVFLLNFLFSFLLSFSIFRLIMSENEVFKTVFSISGIILFLLMWFFHFRNRDDIFSLCLVFLIFTSEVIWV